MERAIVTLFALCYGALEARSSDMKTQIRRNPQKRPHFPECSHICIDVLTHCTYVHTYVRAETICQFVILHIATSNIAIYCIIAIVVYNFM